MSPRRRLEPRQWRRAPASSSTPAARPNSGARAHGPGGPGNLHFHLAPQWRGHCRPQQGPRELWEEAAVWPPVGMGQVGPHLGGVQETDQGDLAPMGTTERRPLVTGRPCQGADGAVGPGHFGQSGRVMALVKYCAFQRGHLCRQPPRAWPGPRGHSSSSRLLQAGRAVTGEARRGGGGAGVETQVP